MTCFGCFCLLARRGPVGISSSSSRRVDVSSSAEGGEAGGSTSCPPKMCECCVRLRTSGLGRPQCQRGSSAERGGARRPPQAGGGRRRGPGPAFTPGVHGPPLAAAAGSRGVDAAAIPSGVGRRANLLLTPSCFMVLAASSGRRVILVGVCPSLMAYLTPPAAGDRSWAAAVHGPRSGPIRIPSPKTAR